VLKEMFGSEREEVRG